MKTQIESAVEVALDELEDSLERHASAGLSTGLSVRDGKVFGVSETRTSGRAPIDSLPSEDRIKELALARNIDYGPEFQGRALSWWASDETVDSYGSIIRQDWSFDRFERQPVIAFNHMTHGESLPIGRGLDWGVENREVKGYSGPSLRIMGLMVPESLNPLAEKVFRLAKCGILDGGSVGFSPSSVRYVRDKAEREAMGLPDHGYICEGNTLFEYSPTTLASNINSAVAARSERDIQGDDWQVCRELTRLQYRRNQKHDEWAKRDEEMRALGSTFFTGFDFSKHDDIEKPMVSEESRRMSGAVNVPLDVRTTEERIDDIQTYVERSTTGMMVAINNVRDMCEEINSKVDRLSNRSDTSGGHESEGESLESIGDTLSSLQASLEAKLKDVSNGDSQ